MRAQLRNIVTSYVQVAGTDAVPDAPPTIRLLGGASIEGRERPLAGRVAHRKRMALLALLAASRTQSAGRERIAALLWPERDADRSRHLLRETVYRLRESLGHDALPGAGGELLLDRGHVRCDLWEFEAALARSDWEAADRLYGGAFLDGFGIDSSEFEHWADLERSRLADLHAKAVESLAAQRAAAGDHAGSVALWKRRAAADPYNSRVALRLMEALDNGGDRVEALQYATRHVELVREELGAAPDPDVMVYAERLRREPRSRANGTNGTMGSNGAPGPLTTQHEPHVARQPSPSAAADAASPGHSAPEPTPGAVMATLPVPRRRRWTRAAYGTFALLGAFAGYWTMLRAAPPIAEGRIAILPFRTSGADPALAFLRDGLVELLSLELRGEIGPTAVDAGEALRASRRAAEPRSRSDMVGLARQLGAGQVTEGSVAGTPARFTVTLSVLHTADGAPRGAPIQVEGSLDSLPALVTAISARLLAPYAGARADDMSGVNAEALRLYLAGMADYRRADWLAAGSRMFRAFGLDSTFVPAAYQFALIHALIAPTTPLGKPPTRDPQITRIYGLLWAQRERLPAEHRRLLEAVADSVYVLWHQQQLPLLERAMALLPNSVEGWELLGDAYYHAGALLGREDWDEAAKRAFARAWMLDSTIAVNATGHLADIAFMERDARAFERHARATHGSRHQVLRRYQAAILRGNPAALRAARVEYSHAWVRGEEDGPEWALRGLTLPPGELDSLLAQIETDASTEQQRRTTARWLADAAAMSGRPGRAATVLGSATTFADSLAMDEAMVGLAEGDSVAAERLVSFALDHPTTVPPGGHPLGCNAALSHLQRGDTSRVAAIVATEPPLDDSRDVLSAFTRYRRGTVAMSAICAEVARGVLTSMTTTDLSRLRRADTLMRHMPLNYADFWNYDVALAFARRGEYALAAAAARRRLHDHGREPLPRLVLSLRQEGRWAALAGDRAAAIKAYEHYLLWRSAPEPALVPQRDSVRRELAEVVRKQRFARLWPF